VGDKASVTVQGTGKNASGTISLISPALDPGSTTLEVWVKVPNLKEDLKPGMPVHVAIESRTLRDVTTVPAESVITTKSGGDAVMVLGADGLAHERDVKLGASDGNNTQVLKGVHAGELIVTVGAHSLEDKTKVAVAPPDEDSNDQGTADASADAGAGGKATVPGGDQP
jgi:RND family efflux transporter MFP subunit